MKKYIKPAIVEVKLDNESILAASLTIDNTAISGDKVGANDLDLDVDLGWDEEL